MEQNYFLGFRRLGELGLSPKHLATVTDVTSHADVSYNLLFSLWPSLTNAMYKQLSRFIVIGNNIAELTGVMIAHGAKVGVPWHCR